MYESSVKTSETSYKGSFIYEGTGLAYALFDEGRLIKDGTNFKYEYFLKDHLGNNRILFTKNTVVEKLQEDHYYPFGMTFQGVGSSSSSVANKYKYNGKELQDDDVNGNKLNMYDYGARFYDPALGRWHVIDPLAEKYPSWSTYNYVVNSPIRFIDPDGKSPGDYDRVVDEWLHGKYVSSVTIDGKGGGSISGGLKPENKKEINRQGVVEGVDEGVDEGVVEGEGEIPAWVIKAIKTLVPVAFSVEVTGSTEAGVAAAASPWGGILIVRGEDAGQYYNFSTVGAVGVGWISANASIVTTNYYYVGDINNFNIETFKGWGGNISVSGDLVVSVGANLSGVIDQYGGYLIGIGVSGGAGVSPTVLSGQYTLQFTKIWN